MATTHSGQTAPSAAPARPMAPTDAPILRNSVPVDEARPALASNSAGVDGAFMLASEPGVPGKGSNEPPGGSSALTHMAGLVAGVLLGLVFSVLGAGGGILAVPLLMLLFGLPANEAMGAGLAVVFIAALTASLGHARAKRIEWRLVLTLAPMTALGAVLGAKLNPLLPMWLTTGLFVVVLLGATASLFLKKKDAAGKRVATPVLLGLGLALGVLTGVLGVGGGFLLVPVLVGLARLPMRHAVGTSAALIAIGSLSGAVTVLLDAPHLVPMVAPVAAGALVGALVGTPLGGKLPERALRFGFAALSVVVAAGMTFKAFTG